MKSFFKWLLGSRELNRYRLDDTLETHECILCKCDPDASYCIPKAKLV